jgi:Uma2 family endonuclease
MEAILRLSRRASYADYLAAEQNSDCRHEFIDGVIVAMAGGSDEYNALTSRLAIALGRRLSGVCRTYSSDQRFWIAARARGRYADGSVICGPPEHPPHDDQATTNPLIVLEVLSPSTEGDDEGDKRADFQSLDSLRAYVLVAQDELRVRVYRRDGATWSDVTYRHGESFDLPALSSPVPVAEIYEGILDPAGHSLLKTPR